jgi:hypothetical protein
MTYRTMWSAAIAATTMLAACSQGQNAPSATPEAPVYGTTTGELSCDDYLTLARACVDKGRFGNPAQRRAELPAVERALRAHVSGAAVAIDHNAVWESASRVGRKEHGRGALEKGSEKRDLVTDALPSSAVCKRAIDQLPTECQ